MSVMYIRNEQTGEFEPVPSLVGPQGPPGTNGDGAGTVTAVNNVAPDTTGNVTLTASDVGARADDWMPTAEETGALPEAGTAVNATQLNGKDASEYALVSDLPTDYLTAETDPTVPAWAKAATKPTYTASEVGALAEDAQAADSAKLGGVDAGFYYNTDNLIFDAAPVLESTNPITSGAVYSGLNEHIKVVEYEATNSFTAGTVGTRGAQSTITIGLDGYTPIAVTVSYVYESAYYIPFAFMNSETVAYVNFYRCTSGAISDAKARIKVVYLKNM